MRIFHLDGACQNVCGFDLNASRSLSVDWTTLEVGSKVSILPLLRERCRNHIYSRGHFWVWSALSRYFSFDSDSSDMNPRILSCGSCWFHRFYASPLGCTWRGNGPLTSGKISTRRNNRGYCTIGWLYFSLTIDSLRSIPLFSYSLII
jgi:hypothetical protein